VNPRPFVLFAALMLAGCAPTVVTADGNSGDGGGASSRQASSASGWSETGGSDSATPGDGGAAADSSQSPLGSSQTTDADGGAVGNGSGGAPACLTCAAALDGAEGDEFCDGSIGVADDLVTCALTWCAPPCPEDQYKADDPACAACVATACAPQLASCEADRD
jgi:hypothetical protein